MTELIICVKPVDILGDHPNSGLLPDSSPIVLCGPLDLFKKRRFTILNSRQSPRIHGGQSWIQKTLEALRSFDPRNHVLVTSLNTTSWDFLSWAGVKIGFPIVLVFPGGSAQNFNIARAKAIMDLGLDERKILALKPLKVGRGRKGVEANDMRDRWILALSDQIVPVSIRQRGNLENYLKQCNLKTKAIVNDYKTPYEVILPIKKPLIPESISLPQWYNPHEYLIHWTRSCVGPWPDEKKADFFRRVMEKLEETQGGLETLIRIIRGEGIKASGRLIRGGYQIVPFTERPPHELPSLIRWRRGLRRWTFEPYGIAMRKSKLIEMGAKPVQYGEIQDFERMSESESPFFQLSEVGKQDWQVEKEWRIQGDVDFSLFQKGEVVFIVKEINEGLQLPMMYPFQVIALGDRS